MIATTNNRKRAATAKALIPAAAYVRMSRKDQYDSPKRQRARIEKYAAANGYDILVWYEDSGISGSKTNLRKAFLAMVDRIETKADIDAIIVENMDRLTRDDSLRFGKYFSPIADADVSLVSVSESKVYDLSDPNDRAMLSLTADLTRNRYVTDLSDKSTDAAIRLATQGRWPGGSVGYAMRRLFVTADGEPVRTLEPGEQRPMGPKFKDHYVMLTLGDDEQVERVRWMFAEYLKPGGTLWSIGSELNHQGVPSPRGSIWRKETVATILRNPVYVGDLVYGVKSKGQHNTVSAGGVRKAKDVRQMRNKLKRQGVKLNAHLNPFSDPVRCPGVFEPIVDRQTYDAVQQKLKAQAKRTTPHKGGGNFLLSGLMRCAHCGGRMHGKHSVTHKGKYRYRQYQCNTYVVSGPSACVRNPVDEDLIGRFLINTIAERALSVQNVRRLRASIERKAKAQYRKPAADDTKRLERELAKLDRDIAAGGERILRCPDDVVDVLVGELQKMREKRDALAKRLSATSKPVGERRDNAASAVAGAMKRLETLREHLQGGDPAMVREVFRSVIDHIDIHCETVIIGRSKRYKFKKGVITLQKSDVLTGTEAPARSAGRSWPRLSACRPAPD